MISGDLTQRARADQFHAARDFAARLPGPVLCVPGNHDVPLYNLPARLFAPFVGYRRNFADELEPQAFLPDAVVQGVNTTNPLAWAAPGLWRIAVMHHAPVPAADGTPADVAYPAATLAALARAGTDIVLSGHTHMPHAGFAETAGGVLFLQVGTAISTRLKTDSNDVALIELGPGSITRHREVSLAILGWRGRVRGSRPSPSPVF